MSYFRRAAKHVPPPVEALKTAAVEPSAARAAQGMGHTEAFALECLEPASGRNLTLQQMWNAYTAWCEKQELVSIAYPLFHEEMERMAQGIGMGCERQGGHVLFFEVALRT